MRSVWWSVTLLAGCGRIRFAELPDGAVDSAASPCPAGFVPITGNAGLGTLDFCAMQTEARAWKDMNGDTIVEESELDADGCDTPACDTDWTLAAYVPVAIVPVTAQAWRSVSAVIAQGACRSLGAGYDLMSNREWMTIARIAELEPKNWFNDTVGDTRIVQGNIDNSGPLPIVDPDDGYTGTGNNATEAPGAGWEERRTLVVGAEVLWDVPGGNQEWIDWTLGGPLDGAPTPCSNAQLPAFSCPGITADDFQSIAGTYDQTVGVGSIIGGSGNATRRGGQTGDLTLGIAGIYALNMNRNVVDTFGATSFRCVYRP